jgi:L,D-transpeptidase catalytic domain
MTSWLKRLSLAFVVGGAFGGGYVAYHDPDSSLRPALNEIVVRGQHALASMTGPASMNARTLRHDPQPEIDTTKLPFIVIEPRDFAAPMIKLPAPAAMQSERRKIPELRLMQAPDQLPMDLSPVEARMRARVPAELFGYFDLFLYVSKSTPDKGSWSQRMFVLAKQDDRTFKVLHNWPVSTGLEEPLVSPSGATLETDTPQGVFKLDRGRFYEDYTSRQWKAPMPNAMFFDWRIEGRTSGLAIHGTDDEGVKELGQRASHGCIRLSPENARTLFELIRDNYRGRVPVFSVDPRTGTMSTTGDFVRDEAGDVKMTRGYKVLVYIEDFGGPSVDTIAALF